MTLQTTIETTGPHESELERRLGSVMWQRVKPSYEKFKRQDAELAAAAAEIARLRPDDAHARASRTSDLESAIESAIEEKRAILEAQHQCFRTSTLRKYIGKRDDREPPTREVIQRVLKKHGLYT